MNMEEKKRISLSRAAELKARIEDYMEARSHIKTGLELIDKICERKEKIKKILGASEKAWNSWKWQLGNRINSAEILGRIIDIDSIRKAEIDNVGKVYAWAVSPYYCTLMDENNDHCPVRLMSIPQAVELSNTNGTMDPMQEELTNPAGTITRRYPDRLIINITSECGSYCRFCQRRRYIGCEYRKTARNLLDESIDYIKDNREIRDVLITGGDPFTLGNNELNWILKSLRAIPHIEIIRIGTRAPVTFPMRITVNLCKMLKKYHPLYINTHFNHPVEVCEESKKAVEKLADSGIPVGNQMVLLKGINNNRHVVKCLNQELLKIRIKPYYIFHPKSVKGTVQFNCSIDEGLDIMEHLRGYTSGLAVPHYIVNTGNGLGKVPLLPEYLIYKEKNCFVLRTWEGKIVRCENQGCTNVDT